MKVSRSRTDSPPGLLTIVPARAADDALSTAPPVESPRVVEAQDAGDAGGRDGGNVVSLAHVRAGRDHAAGGHAAGGHAPAVAPAPDDRPAPYRHHGGRRRSMLVAAGSVMLHAAILAAFAHEPAPVASIGLEVISVEMVLGADAPAGLAATPSESEAAATQQPKTEPEKTEPEKAEEPKPVEEAKAQEPDPSPDPSPDPPTEQVAMVPPPDPVPEPPKEEPRHEPRPEIVDEAPERVAAIPPEPPKPQPKPEIKPEVKPVAKPKPKAKAAPKQRTAARTSDDARPTNPSASRSTSASGIGVGRSDNNTNYRGIVAAHLARHKQFPAEARAAGQQGATSVSFTIDGSGRVTSVRLGRASGISSLDQETTAMVRRASPFPAPPTGQSMSFSVPVSFFLR